MYLYIMKQMIQHIDIVLDKLTNSIKNGITGDSFPPGSLKV